MSKIKRILLALLFVICYITASISLSDFNKTNKTISAFRVGSYNDKLWVFITQPNEMKSWSCLFESGKKRGFCKIVKYKNVEK